MHVYLMSTLKWVKMHLTRQTDFAIRTLVYLAAKPPEDLVQVRQICDLFEISSNHLPKVVNKLANLGYIESQRGRGGGIRLGRKMQDINIGEVVRDMEPTLSPVNCYEPHCVLLPNCRFKAVLADASTAFIDTIEKYTLADLVDQEIEVLRGLESS
jgi:Rrf2 family nitric oxide-sensitive transcriptional repressor